MADMPEEGIPRDLQASLHSGQDMAPLIQDLRSCSTRTVIEAELKTLIPLQLRIPELLRIVHHPNGSHDNREYRLQAAKLLACATPRYFLQFFENLPTSSERCQFLETFIQCLDNWAEDKPVREELCLSFATMISKMSQSTSFVEEMELSLSAMKSYLMSTDQPQRCILGWAIYGRLFPSYVHLFAKKEMESALGFLRRDLNSDNNCLVAEATHSLVLIAIGYWYETGAEREEQKKELQELLFKGDERSWQKKWKEIFSGDARMLWALTKFLDRYQGHMNSAVVGTLMRVIVHHLEEHGAENPDTFGLSLDVLKLLALGPGHHETTNRELITHVRFVVQSLVHMILKLSVTEGSAGKVKVGAFDESPFHSGLFEIMEKNVLYWLKKAFPSVYLPELRKMLRVDPNNVASCMAAFLASIAGCCIDDLLSQLLPMLRRWLITENLQEAQVACYIVKRLLDDDSSIEERDQEKIYRCLRETLWSKVENQGLAPMLRSLAYEYCVLGRVNDGLVGVSSNIPEDKEVLLVYLKGIEDELRRFYWTRESSVLETLLHCLINHVPKWSQIPPKLRLRTFSALRTIAALHQTSGQHQSWGSPVVWKPRKALATNTGNTWTLSMLAVKCALLDMLKSNGRHMNTIKFEFPWIFDVLRNLQPAEAELDGLEDSLLIHVADLNDLWVSLIRCIRGFLDEPEESLTRVVPHAVDSLLRVSAKVRVYFKDVEDLAEARIEGTVSQRQSKLICGSVAGRMFIFNKNAFKANRSGIEGLERILSTAGSIVAQSVLFPLVLGDLAGLMSSDASDDHKLLGLTLLEQWLKVQQREVTRRCMSWMWGHPLLILLNGSLTWTETYLKYDTLTSVQLTEKAMNCLILLIPLRDEEPDVLMTFLSQLLGAVDARKADRQHDGMKMFYLLTILHVIKESIASVPSDVKAAARSRILSANLEDQCQTYVQAMHQRIVDAWGDLCN